MNNDSNKYQMKEVLNRINETLRHNQKQTESEQMMKCSGTNQQQFNSHINTSHSGGIIQDSMLFTFGNQQVYSVLSREEL